MRIVGGNNRGRKFYPPKNIPARPTTDFAKEAIFNMLDHVFYFDGMVFLDLFSGTGSISYEMYSRGCRDITIVDSAPVCVNFIRKTIEDWEMEGVALFQEDVFHFLSRCTRSFKVIFADPPYEMDGVELLPDIILQGNLLTSDGWFILETAATHDFSNHENFLKLKRYGQTNFWIFSHDKDHE